MFRNKWYALILTVIMVTCSLVILLPNTEAREAIVYKTGSTGTVVKTIQQKLINWGYLTGSADGIYGAKTTAAVKFFQSRNNLYSDGIVGTKTAAAMGITLAATASGGSTSYSSSDLYLLAKVVYAEARGEPYSGKVAVAAVVLNRVKNASFPNTISGVVYQPWAFTAVHDGQINLTPDTSATNAARDALNGWDPSSGCIYYFNPATATNTWIWSRPSTITIGKHRFCL